MKLVVTGGAGYVGSNVAARLIEAGHEVIVLDNLSEGHEDAVPEDAKLVNGDIFNFAECFSAVDGIDAVLHFAALIQAGESVSSPEKYWHNNLVGSLKLLEAMRQIGINKLIFSSTAAVYGNPSEVPISETAVKDPTNPYGMTKLAVDMAITSQCQAYGLAATSLRYFNVAGAYEAYGERHKHETHIIPLALAAIDEGREFEIFGEDYSTPDGTCVRDYVHVRDLADAHLLALDNLKISQHAFYNLGNGSGFSNRQVIEAIEKVTGMTMKLKIGLRRPGDPDVLVASSQLAKDKLGWQPVKSDLENIINDAWNFYQINRP